MQIDIDARAIGDMLAEMEMVKTYYYQHVRKRAKATSKRKGNLAQGTSKSPNKLAKSVEVVNQPQSPGKLGHNKFLSTFVNIKDARYQIGPAQTYNTTNIEFPDIGNKKSRSPQPKPKKGQSSQQSFDMLNSSVRYVQRSHVKQSWNRYININSLSRSQQMRQEASQIEAKKKENRSFYRRGRRTKDPTEQNIEGWKSYYQQDEINNVVSHKS